MQQPALPGSLRNCPRATGERVPATELSKSVPHSPGLAGDTVRSLAKVARRRTSRPVRVIQVTSQAASVLTLIFDEASRYRARAASSKSSASYCASSGRNDRCFASPTCRRSPPSQLAMAGQQYSDQGSIRSRVRTAGRHRPHREIARGVRRRRNRHQAVRIPPVPPASPSNTQLNRYMKFYVLL